jgi:hypothetical protein
MKTALITGITGQDGSYLAEFLLEKGYRSSAWCGAARRELRADRAHPGPLELLSGDLTDQNSLLYARCRSRSRTRCTTSAAQSFVQTSWTQPVLTGDVTALGVTRMLEAIRVFDPKIRFYQASSSEMFGKVQAVPQRRTRRSTRARRTASPRCTATGHGELPRELRPVRGERDPVQPRVAAARAGVRDPQGDGRGGAHQAGAGRGAAARQPGRAARLGVRRRLRARDVADAAAGRAGRLRGGDRRDAQRAGAGGGAFERGGPGLASTWCRTRASCARRRWTC